MSPPKNKKKLLMAKKIINICTRDISVGALIKFVFVWYTFFRKGIIPVYFLLTVLVFYQELWPFLFCFWVVCTHVIYELYTNICDMLIVKSLNCLCKNIDYWLNKSCSTWNIYLFIYLLIRFTFVCLFNLYFNLHINLFVSNVMLHIKI